MVAIYKKVPHLDETDEELELAEEVLDPVEQLAMELYEFSPPPFGVSRDICGSWNEHGLFAFTSCAYLSSLFT